MLHLDLLRREDLKKVYYGKSNINKNNFTQKTTFLFHYYKHLFFILILIVLIFIKEQKL